MSFIPSGGGLDKVLSLLSNKVDKITGKGLSTNDYTNTDKGIVDGVTSALAGKANTSDIPTKTSQLTNDSGFITNSVNNLSNYYTKSNTYTKTEVDNKIGIIGGITTATGTYTTKTWAIGTNTCIWKAPAAGTYIIWMRFGMRDDTNCDMYKQLQMYAPNGQVEANLYYEPNGGTAIQTICQPCVATAANQTCTPYIHTDRANVIFDMKIVALRIK